MVKEKVNDDLADPKEYTILVAVDFSPCSAEALKRQNPL